MTSADSSAQLPASAKMQRPAPAKKGAKRGPRAAVAAREADVLDKLSRLADAPPIEAPVELEPLPSIVEADPTYPPAERPAVEHDTGDGSGKVGSVSSTDDDATEAIDMSPLVEASAASVAPEVVPAIEELPTVAAPVLEAPLLDDQSVEEIEQALLDGLNDGEVPERALLAPVKFRRAKPRVRRVTRVVRHVDTWSVFKVALVFNTILLMVCLTAGVLLWNVAYATGTIDNLEKFFEQFGWSSFEFNGGQLYHNAWIAGLFGAIGLTGFAVLLATLFNLITDLVGGIRVSVLEEEVVARESMQPSIVRKRRKHEA